MLVEQLALRLERAHRAVEGGGHGLDPVDDGPDGAGDPIHFLARPFAAALRSEVLDGGGQLADRGVQRAEGAVRTGAGVRPRVRGLDPDVRHPATDPALHEQHHERQPDADDGHAERVERPQHGDERLGGSHLVAARWLDLHGARAAGQAPQRAGHADEQQ